MGKFIDLTGKKFGRLVAIQHIGKDKWGNYKWLCLCDCGQKVTTLVSSLRKGHTKSCRCLQREIASKVNTKHGYSTRIKITETYHAWYNIIQRCTNSNNPRYEDYGDRGIEVCHRWKKFINFLKDMGEAPIGYQIDRIDNNKGYYKKNCRWATRKEQARNIRHNLYVTHDGRTQLLIEWSEEIGILYQTLWYRIYKYGWSTERALTTPVRKRRKHNET